MFLMRQRGGLAGGAAGDDALRAVVEMKLEQVAKRLFVDLPVLERGDDGDKRSGE